MKTYRHICAFYLVHYLIAIIIYTVLVPIVTASPGWIRICSSDQGAWELSSEECSRGVWFKNPFVVDCVCAYGIWVINRGFCDKLASLIVGTGECFSFKEDWRRIRSIKYLGNPSNAFKSEVLLGSRSLDFFESVSKTGYSSRTEYNSTIALIIINSDVTVEGNKEECFRSGRNVPVRIHFPVASTKFTIANWDTECSTSGIVGNRSSSYFDLQFNEYYENNQIYKSDPLCTLTCASTRKTRQISESATKKSTNRNPKSTTQRSSRRILPDSSPQTAKYTSNPHMRRPQSGRSFGSGYNKAAARWTGPYWELTTREPLWKPANTRKYRLPKRCRKCKNKTIVPIPMTEEADFQQPPLNPEQHRAIAQQTFRLMHQQLSYVLKNRTVPGTTIKEYKYLEYSKDIFLKLCPMRPASLFVVHSLFRMFRTILIESLTDYPYIQDEDDSRVHATIAGLKICLKSLSPSLELQSSGCQSTNVNYRIVQLQNGTQLNINTTIPPILKFDLKKYDMAIELTWKMFTFSIYSCAEIFQNNSFLHEIFIVQTEELFKNQKILMRWSNPGKSYEINKLLFSNFNLKRITQEVDRCVTAAKAISIYPNWIQRKRRYIQRRKRSIDQLDEIWDGRGYCMNDYKDPVQKFGYQIAPGCSL